MQGEINPKLFFFTVGGEMTTVLMAATKIGAGNITMDLQSGEVFVHVPDVAQISFGSSFLARYPTKDPQKQRQIVCSLRRSGRFLYTEIFSLFNWIRDQKGTKYPK